jgi:hypothetical protein
LSTSARIALLLPQRRGLVTALLLLAALLSCELSVARQGRRRRLTLVEHAFIDELSERSVIIVFVRL